MICRALLVASAALAPFAVSVEAEPAVAENYAECEARLTQLPHERESSRCFFVVARRQGSWDEAADRLAAHLAAAPEHPWLHFYLGNVLWRHNESEIADHYRAAVELLAASADAAGEVDARFNLAHFLRRRGELAAAGAELEEALEVAERSDDPLVVARARIEGARQALQTGADLGWVLRLLRQAEVAIFPDGPYFLRRDCLDALGRVYYELGRYRQAVAYAERLVELAQNEQDAYAEASATYQLTVIHTRLDLPSAARREQVRQLAEKTIASALRADHPMMAARGHALLGKLSRAEASLYHLDRCLTLAENHDFPTLRRDCSGTLAEKIVDDDPERASQLIDQVLAETLDDEDPWALLVNWAPILRVLSRTRPAAEVLAMSARALSAFETLRDAQRLETERLRLTSIWSEVYSQTAGLWLDNARRTGDAETLATAFAWIERARAASLLMADDPTLSPALRDEDLAAILRAEARVYRRLLDPRLAAAERVRLIADLDELELREAELRHTRAAPLSGVSRAGQQVELAEIEASLAADQALLVFQLAFWEDLYGNTSGGAWLLAVTRRGTASYRLPDRRALEPVVQMLLGLEDPQQHVGALVGLYDQLLGEALDELPASVERLVILPDGILHLLPFALLRATPAGAPLAARYQLTRVPSATFWHSTREDSPVPAARPILALADPVSVAGSEPEMHSARRDWTLATGFRPAALPYARREARAAVRRLRRQPGEARLLLGESASERLLKQADLADYAVLHLAAHTLLDDEKPQRSAVLLAAGAAEEDGLLRPREIAGLDLAGRVVVLSGCSSASGGWLQGAGVMSLARAFFQAGAAAVIGSLWPLPDDQAAAFFDPFYRHLNDGASVATAFTEAQRSRMRQGAPAVGWAGFEALGNTEIVPFPVARRAPAGWPRGLLVTGAALVLLSLVRMWRTARRVTDH